MVTEEYEPFTFKDLDLFIGKIVKDKKKDFVGTLISANEWGSIVSYEDMLRDYTFLDGTPCGKLKSCLF